jgi:hypothetical protein
MGLPHPGQADGGRTTLLPSGRRAITTLRKLPMTRPKRKHVASRNKGGSTA